MKLQIIRVDGSEEVYEVRPESAFREAHWLIHAQTVDIVILTRSEGRAEKVMLVNDLGHQLGLEVNQKATELYWSVCRPGTTHQIVGDVAILNDQELPE